MGRKIGVIRSWHETRGFGVISVGKSGLERYFFHVSRIRSGTGFPVAGMTVEFDVNTKPPKKENDLWAAVNVDVIVDSTPSNEGAL